MVCDCGLIKGQFRKTLFKTHRQDGGRWQLKTGHRSPGQGEGKNSGQLPESGDRRALQRYGGGGGNMYDPTVGSTG